MNPYINIHTHHLSTDNNVFLFNNRFGFDKEFYLEKYFSIGIHPWDIHVISDNKMIEFEKLIQNPNCLAIGECGLDKVCKSDFRKQKYFLTEQLQFALKYNKPVIIHCVKAYDDLIGVCKPFIHKIPLIIHGFNKTDELAKQLINKGFYLSVSDDFLKKTKLEKELTDKLFFETDDKQPLSIIEIYELASKKWDIDKELLKKKISSNFASLFKLTV